MCAKARFPSLPRIQPSYPGVSSGSFSEQRLALFLPLTRDSEKGTKFFNFKLGNNIFGQEETFRLKCRGSILECNIIKGGKRFFKYSASGKIIGKFRRTPSLHLTQGRLGS